MTRREDSCFRFPDGIHFGRFMNPSSGPFFALVKRLIPGCYFSFCFHHRQFFYGNRLWTETRFFADSKRNNKIFVTDIIKHIIPQKTNAGGKRNGILSKKYLSSSHGAEGGVRIEPVVLSVLAVGYFMIFKNIVQPR